MRQRAKRKSEGEGWQEGGRPIRGWSKFYESMMVESIPQGWRRRVVRKLQVLVSEETGSETGIIKYIVIIIRLLGSYTIVISIVYTATPIITLSLLLLLLESLSMMAADSYPARPLKLFLAAYALLRIEYILKPHSPF